MSKIIELEAELNEINDRIAQETDDNLIAYLLSEKTKVETKIAEARKAEEINEKVESEAVPFAVAGISLDGIPVEVVRLIEEIVKTDRRRIYNEHAIELEHLESKLKDCESVGLDRGLEIDRLKTELLGAHEEAIERTNHYTKEVYTLTAELADAESKRDAAVREKEELAATANTQLSDAAKQIEALQAELEGYRQAKEYQERQAAVVTPDANETVSLQEKLEAVKKLYTHTEDWGSVVKVFKPDGSFEVTKRAALESEWAHVDVPEISFQENAAVPEHSPDGEMDETGTGEVETFEQEMRRRVAMLETSVYGEIRGVA